MYPLVHDIMYSLVDYLGIEVYTLRYACNANGFFTDCLTICMLSSKFKFDSMFPSPPPVMLVLEFLVQAKYLQLLFQYMSFNRISWTCKVWSLMLMHYVIYFLIKKNSDLKIIVSDWTTLQKYLYVKYREIDQYHNTTETAIPTGTNIAV